MTDRDTFAAAALTGLLLDGNEAQVPASHIAECAYKLADAMLRERGAAVRDNCVSGNNPEIGCQHPTGNAQEPMAWAVVRWFDNAISLFCFEKVAAEKYASQARGDTCYRHDVIPLYRAPQPTLTYEERQAVLHYATEFKGPNAAILRKLLGRTSHDAAPEAIATNDGGTPKDADGTGNTQEPVAWAIQFAGEDIDVRSVFSDMESACRHVANYAGKNQIVPLYRSPDAERLANARLSAANVALIAERDSLRSAIRRLADQDATLSVQSGNVTVTLDATLTDEEREAVEDAVAELTPGPIAATLRSLLARLHSTPQTHPTLS
jgi:hypothetical protein